ncbi:hypothetical protein GBF38_018249 [Nibea albiflora]|uniref:Uncharacterized protein n=1 Tax=Nibea albiflora TaxID=240163 RepID=A0ACB7EGI9_NIBAL|nr:hypothetical protein GBF38_018249 [Nibea albiflora]
MEEQVDTVSSYINFCVDSIIPSKTVTIFPINKPWITKELNKKKKRIFFTGSESEKKEVNREVKRAIKTAKLKYKNMVEEKFTQGNLRLAWQGLKTMAAVNIATTNHKPIQVAGSSSTSLPDDLNTFYTWFEMDNSTQIAETLSSLEHGGTTLIFKTDEVVRALRRTRENSSPGPDNISGRVLRLCAEQLGGVFQTLFQRSMDTGTVPQLWKHSTVIPIP